MNVIEILIKLFPGFFSFGPWLSKKGIGFAVILGFIVAFILISSGMTPTLPENHETTSYPLWQCRYLVISPMLSVIIWFLITQGYLRTGRGTKIGLAYDGHKVDILDWKRTKKKLCDLLKSGEIKNEVTLKFVPLDFCANSEIADKYQKRYGFTILLKAQQSPLLTNDPDNAQNPIPVIVKPVIATTAEADKFVQTTFKDILKVNKMRNSETTLADSLDAQAQNVHDMLLLFVASHCYLKKDYEDAAIILKFLDESLSPLVRPDQNPRKQIRALIIHSCLGPSRFSTNEIPQLDKLLEIRKFAETALPFFDDSYYVPIDLSRIRFLTEDIEGAIELTERFKERIEEVKEGGQEPAKRALIVYYLNSGFLEFIRGHWMNAYESYRSMLSIDEYRNESWKIIIEFIDYVESLERYDGICYLQTFYRLIINRSVPKELRTAAQEWVERDDSRKELRSLLSRSYLPNRKKTNDQGKTAKQRSKRNKKPRNRKRKKR